MAVRMGQLYLIDVLYQDTILKMEKKNVRKTGGKQREPWWKNYIKKSERKKEREKLWMKKYCR